MTSVLIVDDERQLRRALTLNFAARGFEVFESTTGEAALADVADQHPDLILLDLGLPGMDGVTVIEALRGWTSIPIIVLTVRDDELSKVRALDAGADDYVTKPFGMAELVARVRAILRRYATATGDPGEIVTANFRLDLKGNRAFVGFDHTETRLTPTEWAIVRHLVLNPKRLITHRQLITAVWGPSYQPDQSLLRVHMARIRRKLEPDHGRPLHFITDSGIGYRYEPGAAIIDAGSP